MKKNLLLRLCLMMVLALSIYSCASDDLLVSSSDSSQNISSARYSSKSPWAEDQIYITKVQQVFLKHSNLPRFNETYGELNWDYAMSFGQFGERYALVP
ncbi:hypothetical protein, partial [Chryseobacterium sp. CFBP8996]|uniref:hypothetical protein n=1 Tax=Chryseobacterium sp. CFBP8996 TaxID=3096529 RepID=UPI002A6B3D97